MLNEIVRNTVFILAQHAQLSYLMHYIFLTNLQLGHNKNFWKEADCHLAYELIIGIALQSFPLKDRIKSVEDSFKPENGELAFNLFQIPTLCFSYYASTQRRLRKFWGIRKGLFG